jgi:hypothetical protein
MHPSALRPLLLGMSATSVLLAGCASDPDPIAYRPGGDIELNVAGRATSARLAPGELTGPQVSLALDERSLRGTAYGRVVDVSLKGDEVSGLYAGQQMNLQLQQQEPVGFRAQGNVAGGLSNFTFSPEFLDGSVGPCSYTLRRAGPPGPGSGTGGSGGALVYQGQRNCAGTRLAPTTLTLPAGFTMQDGAAQAAILGVMLTR